MLISISKERILPVDDMSIEDCIQELRNAGRLGKDGAENISSVREIRKRMMALRRDIKASYSSKTAPFIHTKVDRKTFEQAIARRFGTRILSATIKIVSFTIKAKHTLPHTYWIITPQPSRPMRAELNFKVILWNSDCNNLLRILSAYQTYVTSIQTTR